MGMLLEEEEEVKFWVDRISGKKRILLYMPGSFDQQ
jgi:hypothetical protein